MIYGKYGEYYDLIYSVKNYDSECKGLIDDFKKFSKNNVRSVLDVGCGTGNHVILLAQKGCKVVGIDTSKIMITQAKKKAEEQGLPVNFDIQDMKSFDLKKKFDAVICLFGTLDYCITDEELKATFSGIWNHLKKEGLFIFDFWPVHPYATRETWRTVLEMQKDKTSIIRIMEGSSFDYLTNMVKIKIKCYVIKSKKVLDSFQEEHNLRTFTPAEIAHVLKENGFKPLDFFKVEWQLERPYSLDKIDSETTNIACIARKS